MTHDEMHEIKRHFDVVAEALTGRIQQVAEGHQVLVSGQSRILGRIDQLESEMKAMLNLSFAELDRRVRVLEQSLGTIERRLERLEAPSARS
jgi:ABC-type molybdenum transport system ATPase subunit/photorepair protein PhrA